MAPRKIPEKKYTSARKSARKSAAKRPTGSKASTAEKPSRGKAVVSLPGRDPKKLRVNKAISASQVRLNVDGKNEAGETIRQQSVMKTEHAWPRPVQWCKFSPHQPSPVCQLT